MDPVRTPSDRQLGRLLLLMCVALALVIGAASSLNVALPDIASSIGASQTQLSWVVNAYALVFAGLLLPIGFAADRFGRREFLVAGLVLFGATTLGSGFVSDPHALILLRGAAGLGAAAVMPATLSALVDAFPPERRTHAVSVWAGVSSGGAVIGIVACGVLLTFFWWGSIQVLYGLLALAVALPVAVTVPASRNPSLTLDPVGGLTSFVGLSGLVLGIIEGPDRGWTDVLTLTALTVGAVGLVAFVLHEAHSAAPMLDVRLFLRPTLAAGSLLVFLQFLASFGLFFLLPQFLQVVQGNEPLGAALRLLPMGLGIGPASQLAPRLMNRYGPRVVGVAGMLTMASGFTALAVVGDGAYWKIGLLLVVFGFGFGTAVTPATSMILAGLPADRRTLSAAVNDVTREVGGALGGSIAASVLLSVYAKQLNTTGLPAGVDDAARNGIGTALAVAGKLGAAGEQLANSARAAFTSGYSAALFVAAGVLVIGALLGSLLAPSADRAEIELAEVADLPTPAADTV
jgi:EmrB/QacA subfamily drug resistance transporter